MFTKSMLTSLTIVSLFASQAMAQESQTTTMGAPRPSAMNVNDPVGWFPFIGLAGGYMSSDDTLKTEGTPGDLKILGSYFSESRRSVADLGLGFMADSFSQKSDTQNNFISGGLAELAWRYNSSNRWQIGPIIDAYIGGGQRYGSTDPTWTSFGGLQILKEFPIRNSNMFRVGLKGLTDLSIPGAVVNTVSLDLQWGFGKEQVGPQIGAAEREERRVTARDEEMRAEERAISEEAGTSLAMNSRRIIESDPENRAITLRNDERMQFDTGRTTLTGYNADFVERVGRALSQRPDLFEKVEAIGYADQTGPADLNMRVSRARSEQVVKSLVGGGLARNKVESSWKGSEDPLYKSLLPEDMQQNRRVDLKFHGVKDQKALEELLSAL